MELLDEDKLLKVPILVFANKQDLKHSAKAQEVKYILFTCNENYDYIR